MDPGTTTSAPPHDYSAALVVDDDDDGRRPITGASSLPSNVPSVSLLTPTDPPLVGQSLYLGGELSISHGSKKIYCIPGHATRVLVIDASTTPETTYQIGPAFHGQYKWLRGIVCPDSGVIYGLPCHADCVLRIDPTTDTVTTLPLPDTLHDDESKSGIIPWKYHGGAISPIDSCIYAIPQSASRVLRINPKTDECTYLARPLPGKYKWYGGLVGKYDGCVYGIPQNHPSVLRINPAAADDGEIDGDDDGRGGEDEYGVVTLHGDFGAGGHKWHGGAASSNGTIIGIPNNADSVLVVKPPQPQPQQGRQQRQRQQQQQPEVYTVGGDSSEDAVKTGRHRTDGRYKYLGAAVRGDRVYCFPSGAERVLEVDTTDAYFARGGGAGVGVKVRNVGDNICDAGLERISQNKWQNGFYCPVDDCLYGIPLNADRVLRIQLLEGAKGEGGGDGDVGSPDGCAGAEVKVKVETVGELHMGLNKWEGGIMVPDTGVMYCMPNNCKSVLRIAPAAAISSRRGRNSVDSSAKGTDREGRTEETGCGGVVRDPQIPHSSSSSMGVPQCGIETRAATNDDGGGGGGGGSGSESTMSGGGHGTSAAAKDGGEAAQGRSVDQGRGRNDGGASAGSNGGGADADAAAARARSTQHERVVVDDPGRFPYRYGIPTLRSAAHRVRSAKVGSKSKSKQKQKKQNQKQKQDTAGGKGNIKTMTGGGKNGRMLPEALQREGLLTFDTQGIDVRGAVVALLRRADPDLIGRWDHQPEEEGEKGGGEGGVHPPTAPTADGADPSHRNAALETNGHRRRGERDSLLQGGPHRPRLEDFRVPPSSLTRAHYGGRCEEAQRYLSNCIAADETFLSVFDRLVVECVLPALKARLVECGIRPVGVAAVSTNVVKGEADGTTETDIVEATAPNGLSFATATAAAAADDDNDGEVYTFYVQRPPTLRIQPGPSMSLVKPHADVEYGHQGGEINYWLSLTDAELTGRTHLHVESSPGGLGDYRPHPLPCRFGEIISFFGSYCRHHVPPNGSPFTRVSFDFRVGVGGYFDPTWQMLGTKDDHHRWEVRM